MRKSLWIFCLLVGAVSIADTEPSGSTVHEVGAHEHGTHSECPLPKNAQDILSCAKKNHPDVRRALLRVERAKAQPDAVSQIPNPSLQVQSVYGTFNSAAQMQTQISLTQPLGLGGGRSARRQEAEARANVSGGELGITQADVVFQTVVHLHRLRQLLRERAIVTETLGTYGKLLRQYESRPALTAEQEVSRGTLEMAQSDYLLKQTALLDEERQISHFFHTSTGHSLAEISNALPSLPSPWPSMDSAASKQASPEISRLLSEKEVATAELSLAQSKSWPDVSLGPMVMLDQEGDRKRQFFGFQLDIPLPVFNLNGAGRAAASVGISASERAIELQRRDEGHERNEQSSAYRSATQALAEAPPVEKVNERHRSMEKQFLRGVVPSALILEAHRQLLELEKSRHERELTAIRSLWNLYRIDGKILEATL